MTVEAMLLLAACMCAVYAIGVALPALAMKPPWLIVLEAAIKQFEAMPTLAESQAECDHAIAEQKDALERVRRAYEKRNPESRK